MHDLKQTPVSAAEMQFSHTTRSPRASQIAGRVVCGSKVDVVAAVSARDSVAMEKSFLQQVFEVLCDATATLVQLRGLPPTALVIHSCERTTAMGQRKLGCSCFFRWSMVMARSSVHRRDDTLDLVQIVPKVDKIILVFTTIIQEICLLVLTAISHQLYKHTR